MNDKMMESCTDLKSREAKLHEIAENAAAALAAIARYDVMPARMDMLRDGRERESSELTFG